MFSVDSALCGFQMFIYSGYTLRPFIIIIIVFEKLTQPGTIHCRK